MDVAGVVFQIDAGPAEAGSRRSIGAIERLEARIETFLVKAKQIQKEIGGALSLGGGGRGGGSGDGGANFSKAEAAAVRHAQRLEQIAARAGARIAELEQKKQAQLETLRERGASREQVLQSQSAARITEIERKKQAQIEVLRERAAIQEAARQRRTASAPSDAAAFFKRYASTIREAGESIQQFGYGLTALSAGLVNVGRSAVGSAIDIDRQVNVLKALTGSADAAERRFASLSKLSQATPGLTTNLAATLDAQLRVADVTEQAINRVLPAIGKLNAVSPLGDPQRFVGNLTQLITQNFEKADLKELVGNSPLAGEILKGLFRVDSPTNAKAIRESAKRLGINSTDAFFTAFAEAAQTNSKLSGITESLGTRIEKLRDRVAVAIRPIGLAIVDTLAPLVEKAVPLIERLTKAFSDLPAGARQAIVVLSGVTALIGPLIIGLGGAIQALGAFGNLFTVISGLFGSAGAAGAGAAAGGGLAAALGPIAIVLAGLAAEVALLYVAWKKNFGGIQEITADAVEFIKDIFADISDFWREIAPEIVEAFNFLSATVKPVWAATWEFVKTYVREAMDVVQQIIRTILSLLRGDFDGFKTNLLRLWAEIFDALITITSAGIVAVADALGGGLSKIAKSLLGISGVAGGDIGRSIVGGIIAGIAAAFPGISSFIEGAIGNLRSFIGGKNQAANAGRQERKFVEGVNADAANALAIEEELIRRANAPATPKAPKTPGVPKAGGSSLGALRDARIALEESRTAKLLAAEKNANETRQRFLDIALAGNLVSVRRYYEERAKLLRADAALEIAEQEKKIQEQRKKAVEIADSLPGQLAKAKTPAQRETVENRAATEIAKAKKIVVDAEKEIAAINAKTAEAIANDTKAATQAQRELADAVFDVRKELLELSGQGFTAKIEEDTKRANEQINKLLVNGKFIAALQAAQNRDTRNNRTRASGIGEEVDTQRQQAELERLRIQNDVTLGVIGEGAARKQTLAVEGELREAIAQRLEAQLLLSKGDEKAVLAIRRQIEELRTLATDERALREQRAKGGFLNDKAFVDTAKSQAKDARLSEQENTAKEIIRIQDQIATAGEGSADRIQLAYLKAFRGIQQENERAAEEVIAAQVKLQNNLNVDPARLNDGVIKLLATQKTLQESLQDFRTAEVQTVFDGIEKGVDKLTEKFGIAGKAIGQLLKDLAKLAVSKLLEKVLGISPTGTQSAAPQQQGGGGILGGLFGGGQQGGGLLGGLFGSNRQQSSGGGLLGGLFGGGNRQTGASSGGGLLGGLFGGGQSSPASFLTGGFAGGNPAQAALGGQGGGGGLLGKIPLIGKLFGGGASSAGGGATGAASGGLGFLSKIPLIGRLFGGGASAAAGAAGSAGSAGASAGGFGALFSNPVTAAVAIGAIAAPFVIKLFGGLFGGGDFKKFRSQVQGLYQIKVDGKQEGKSLFEAVKGLGEQAFGKGSFKNKISETIQLKKAQEAIAAYGESTGQTDSPLVKKFIKKREIADASASENNFVRRATGGVVPGVDTGRDYVRALLRGGEFVTVPEVVQAQGKGRFDALNKGDARILTNREIENLRKALQSVPFFSRKMRERVLGQLNLRESVSAASFNRGYGNGGYVMPATQAFASGGYVFPQTSAQQASIEQSTSRAQASNTAQSVATGAQSSQAASQREAALMNEIRGNRVVMARLVEVIDRLDSFDANTIVGMASPDAVASKTVEGFQSDSTIASRAQQGLGLRT